MYYRFYSKFFCFYNYIPNSHLIRLWFSEPVSTNHHFEYHRYWNGYVYTLEQTPCQKRTDTESPLAFISHIFFPHQHRWSVPKNCRWRKRQIYRKNSCYIKISRNGGIRKNFTLIYFARFYYSLTKLCMYLFFVIYVFHDFLLQ